MAKFARFVQSCRKRGSYFDQTRDFLYQKVQSHMNESHVIAPLVLYTEKHALVTTNFFGKTQSAALPYVVILSDLLQDAKMVATGRHWQSKHAIVRTSPDGIIGGYLFRSTRLIEAKLACFREKKTCLVRKSNIIGNSP